MPYLYCKQQMHYPQSNTKQLHNNNNHGTQRLKASRLSLPKHFCQKTKQVRQVYDFKIPQSRVACEFCHIVMFMPFCSLDINSFDKSIALYWRNSRIIKDCVLRSFVARIVYTFYEFLTFNGYANQNTINQVGKICLVRPIYKLFETD